jgi:hypothetical protein
MVSDDFVASIFREKNQIPAMEGVLELALECSRSPKTFP